MGERMVRAQLPGDMDAIMHIWFDSNVDAHGFIPREYWESHLSEVREAILGAEVFVFEGHGRILGFVGLIDDCVAGLFVGRGSRGQGVGSQLIEHAKGLHDSLRLEVYRENGSALRFYQRHGFAIEGEQLDPSSGREEFLMRWPGKTDPQLPKASGKEN